MRAVLGSVARRAWIVLLAAALGGVGAWALVEVGGGLARADATLIVASPDPARGLGGANDAVRLAQTYAGLIPESAGVVRAVDRAVDPETKYPLGGLTVSNDKDTAIVRVRYSASGEGEALAGARAVVGAVTRGTAGIPAGTLRVVRPALPSSTTTVLSRRTAVPIGVALGALLGLLIVAMLERSRPRIRSQEDLADALGCPAVSLSDLTPAATTALVERWRAEVAGPHPKVALLAGAKSIEPALPWLAQRIGAAAGGNGEPAVALDAWSEIPPGDAAGNGVPAGDGAWLVYAGAPGTRSGGEAVAAHADIVVLAVPQGTREDDLRTTAVRLERFDASPAWALLVPPRALTKPAADEPDAVAVSG